MSVNYTIVLEYLKLILSWPCITLFIVLIVMRKYGEPIKELLLRLRSFKGLGAEASFDPSLLVEAAIDVFTREKQKQIQDLPESDAKAEKIAKSEIEIQQLRIRLTEAISSRLGENSSVPNNNRVNTTFKQLLLVNILAHNCADIIAHWIVENDIQASEGRSDTNYTLQMMEELIVQCRKKVPEVLDVHTLLDIEIALRRLIIAQAPVSHEPLVMKPTNDSFLDYTPGA